MNRQQSKQLQRVMDPRQCTPATAGDKAFFPLLQQDRWLEPHFAEIVGIPTGLETLF
jgi:hypothetical protein